MILYPTDWAAHSLGVANYMREHASERFKSGRYVYMWITS